MNLHTLSLFHKAAACLQARCQHAHQRRQQGRRCGFQYHTLMRRETTKETSSLPVSCCFWLEDEAMSMMRSAKQKKQGGDNIVILGLCVLKVSQDHSIDM